MEDITWTIAISVIFLAWIARKMIIEYKTSKKIQTAYQQKLKEVLNSPNSQVKGRFE
jgi:hypothetical protein